MGKSIREANLFKNEKIAIAFGSAYRGLFDLLQEEEIAMCDVILNVVPGQMVKSIRTEEAIYYTLSVLRLLDVV
jgi:predicted SPOUT superfamily RNA methylase MTH1